MAKKPRPVPKPAPVTARYADTRADATLKVLEQSRARRDAAVNSTRTGFTKPTEMVDKEEYKKKSGRR